MRILSVGCHLPDSQVDNYDWATAPSFFDYDVLVIDPAEAVSKLIEGLVSRGESYLTYEQQPVEDGPTTATTIGLADLLRRRRDETERLLARGGLVICFAQPDVPHPKVGGFTGAHRYYWLPAPTGKDYGSAYLKQASGSYIKPIDYEHPFADFFLRQNYVSYRAIFAEGGSGLGEDAKVIARSTGDAPVALDLSLGGGRLIFLPQPRDHMSTADRAGFANNLVGAIRNTILDTAEGTPPDWLDAYPLPGVVESKSRIEAAETQIEEAELELNNARNELRGVDRFQRLLWQEGKYGLDLPVRDALAQMGFLAYSRPDEPAVFYYEGATVFLETQGSTGAVGMEPHYRLRERLEQKIASEGRRPRGLIIVNGQRELPPRERTETIDDSLRVAAESMRYCVAEASDLFTAVRDFMEGRKEEAAAFCMKLIETEGVLSSTDQEAEPSEAPVKQ